MPKATIIGKMIKADNIRLKAPSGQQLWETQNPPPMPPEGSGCDYFCAGPAGPDGRLFIYLSTVGQCYIQQVHTLRDHWTRFGFTALKGRPSGISEPLIIGFAKESVVLNPSLFFNTANWEKLWAGEEYTAIALPEDALPTAGEYYWIQVDVDYIYDYAEPIFLVAITNDSHVADGWSVGRYDDAECFGMLSRGQWNGDFEWVNQSPKKMLSIVHTAGGTPWYEGYAAMENPSFPTTAQNNEEWLFSFDLSNALASFCACPETLWLKMWQLDGEGGNKVGDPIISWEDELPCGYYFPIAGSIIFNDYGGYSFYGRLEIGHKEGAAFITDGHGDFTVQVYCTDDEWFCDINGAKWVCTNGIWVKQTPSPHPDCYTTCEEIPTKTECEDVGCLWWNQACHSVNPTTCDELNNETDCERWSCAWWNNSCHGYNPSTCEELNNQTDCELYECHWYNNSCHSDPQQPKICDWIDAQGGPSALTIGDIFVIIDSYVYNTPPSGYTFVPTITNTFGVIDYYLGFDGDAKTGCDYY